jgi:Domain of unknown function (DUF4160)
MVSVWSLSLNRKHNITPEISRFLGIIVAMYYNEHNPPHFHARYGDHKIEIAIKTLSILAGKLPPKALGLVMEWATQHQDELMTDWELARQNSELKKIAPLEQKQPSIPCLTSLPLTPLAKGNCQFNLTMGIKAH